MGRSRKKKPFNPLAIFERVSDIHEFNWIRNVNRQSPNDPFGYFKVYAFKCDCKDPMYDEWESADRLAAQGEYCENPKCELKLKLLPSKGPTLSATPCYHTEGAYFGMFQCPTCKVVWQSAYAYANTYQACKTCETHVYSYDMSDQPIWNFRSRGNRPPHNQALCEKCKDKDQPCYQKRARGRGNWDRYYFNSTSTSGGQGPPKPPKKRGKKKKKKSSGVKIPVEGPGSSHNPTATVKQAVLPGGSSKVQNGNSVDLVIALEKISSLRIK